MILRSGDRRSVVDPLKPCRDSGAVAQALLANAMCVACIMRKTGLTLDAVLDALRVLEGDIAVVRAWRRCPVCSNANRAVLTIG